MLGVEIGTALQKWAEQNGLLFKLQSPVSSIVTDEDGRATGVALASGEIVPADIVIAGVGAIPVRCESSIVRN